ncbi:N(4)-acetylcytidine aminohydrolase [Photobacterium gaetbulicola]|nr:N(4)-acetylcytidine aminohydrolase [Photobacterium gaetbulicola]
MAIIDLLFLSRFEEDILAGKKTITIRDEADSHYEVGSRVNGVIYEESRVFCQLDITGVEPVSIDALNQSHAERENMPLSVLKDVLEEIYPKTRDLYVVSFQLVAK